MNTREDFDELARLCVRQASVSCNKDAAAELRRMAREYQDQTAKLDGSKPAKSEKK